MTAYDVDRLKRELSLLDVRTNSTNKGNRLHFLTHYLLEHIPGVTVRSSKALDHAKSDEKDLWIRHSGVCGLPFSDLFFPVECKNEQRSTSASKDPHPLARSVTSRPRFVTALALMAS